MQKYRADYGEKQSDGATVYYSRWLGGPTMAKITNCRLDIAGEPRRAVYITGEPDTFFSIPAVTRYLGCRVKGYVTSDDDRNIIFRPVFY